MTYNKLVEEKLRLEAELRRRDATEFANLVNSYNAIGEPELTIGQVLRMAQAIANNPRVAAVLDDLVASSKF